MNLESNSLKEPAFEDITLVPKDKASNIGNPNPSYLDGYIKEAALA